METMAIVVSQVEFDMGSLRAKTCKWNLTWAL